MAEFRLDLSPKRTLTHLLHSDTDPAQWAAAGYCKFPTEQLQVQWPASGSCCCGEFTQPQTYATLHVKFNSCSVSETVSLTFLLKLSERSWADTQDYYTSKCFISYTLLYLTLEIIFLNMFLLTDESGWRQREHAARNKAAEPESGTLRFIVQASPGQWPQQQKRLFVCFLQVIYESETALISDYNKANPHPL